MLSDLEEDQAVSHAMQMIDRHSCVIVLAGPTAVGKTAVALTLAEKYPSEIISADSRQVYRYLNIGTAKPSHEDRLKTPHHFVDICNPDEGYSAGQFGREARGRVLDILARGKLPLIVGGSGLYLRALLQGFSEPLPSNRTLRDSLKQRVQQEGSAALHAELQRVDPDSARHLHPNDGHRIARALEICYTSQVSQRRLWETPSAPAPFAHQTFVLNLERKALYSRINRRVELMIAAGLVEECRHLLDQGYSAQLNALQTVGYQEVFQFLSGQISRNEMIALIQRHSRQYAKRQLTWFRKMPDCHWLELAETDTTTAVAERLIFMMLQNESRRAS